MAHNMIVMIAIRFVTTNNFHLYVRQLDRGIQGPELSPDSRFFQKKLILKRSFRLILIEIFW